jgi:hypothetical protein
MAEDFDDIKAFRANQQKVRDHFTALRTTWTEGDHFLNVRFDIQNRNIIGKLNSLERDCLEKAGDPNADVGKILAWADKELESD